MTIVSKKKIVSEYLMLNVGSESRSVVSDSLWPHGLYSPWISQARILEWVDFPFSRGIFPTQGLNPNLPHCRQILYQLSHDGSGMLLRLNTISSNEVDETGPYYIEWSKPERKTPVQYTNTYIWNLERW